MTYIHKIISLLLFGGLILPFGQNKAIHSAHIKYATPIVCAKIKMQKIKTQDFTFLDNVLVYILPALKN